MGIIRRLRRLLATKQCRDKRLGLVADQGAEKGVTFEGAHHSEVDHRSFATCGALGVDVACS